MYSSKLVNIFLQLNRKEKQHLKLWIKSPISNSRKDVVDLFDFIYSKRSIYPNNVNREDAYKSLYPNSKYDDKQMRYIMSFATQCMEEFLAYNQWKKNNTQERLDLIININHKNLNAYAFQEINVLQHDLHKQPLRNSSYYHYSYLLCVEQYRLQSKNKRNEDFDLQAISDNLHYYTISEILKHACVCLSLEQVSYKKFNFYLTDQCIELIESNDKFKKVPSVYVYYLCYKISVAGNEQLFKEIHEAIYKYERHFNEGELKDIFIIVINYCIAELNIGKQEYAKYAYQLYLYSLQKGYLLDNGELSRFTFKNIAFIGIKKLKDFKSVENFIEKFKHMLNKEYRESTVLFNTATLCVEKKDYKKAMQILQKVEFEDVLWNINAKSMLLRIYYEEREYDSMLSMTSSLKLYLRRQKEIGIYKIRYMNMINFCLKLHKHVGASTNTKEKLLDEARSNSSLHEKDWIIEMIHKL